MSQTYPNAAILDSVPADRRDGIESAITRIEAFVRRGALKEESFRGRRVLDWECGRGDFSIAFLVLGAAEVLGTDTWLDQARTAGCFAGIESARFQVGSLKALLAARVIDPGSVDLVFANTVTEHLPDLAEALLSVNDVLKPGGSVYLNHGNYYGPSGHHDFAFVDNVGQGAVGGKAVPCWDTTEKCAASAEYRATLARTRGWMWNAVMDRSLTPENCSRCLYKRRAEPWAHLLHQEDFADLYPLANFSMGKPKSSLNKITLFQLRQMIVEAGFKITGTDQTNCSNEPPAELLGPPHYFSRNELRTWMYRVAAVKARDMRDLYPAKS